VGVESLSQSVVDLLDKNQTRQNVIRLTEAVLSRGGQVLLGLMDRFPFLNDGMVAEARDTLEQLKQVASKYPYGRVWFWNNGPVCWNSVESMVGVDEYTVTSVTQDFKLYIPKIVNKEVLRCNQEMAQALLSSGIKVMGKQYRFDLK
jgi:hypothetical protein